MEEERIAKDKNTEISNQSKVSDSINIIDNPQKISDYISNPEDPDDEKIHLQLLELGETAKELFKDNSYCKLIIDEAKNHIVIFFGKKMLIYIFTFFLDYFNYIIYLHILGNHSSIVVHACMSLLACSAKVSSYFN